MSFLERDTAMEFSKCNFLYLQTSFYWVWYLQVSKPGTITPKLDTPMDKTNCMTFKHPTFAALLIIFF